MPVPFFGCTATLTNEAEAFVLGCGGFREQGPNTHQLRIIRTPIDRPDISIVVQCLERKTLRNDYRRLFFLLDGMQPGGLLSDIPKTIIYIDSRRELAKARHALVKHLEAKGVVAATATSAMVVYHSLTPAVDQRLIYDKFRRTDSPIRIILATVALGMGMDIPDVKRVVQFRAVTSMDLADLWQRFGRAVRGDVGQGTAYFFPLIGSLTVWEQGRKSYKRSSAPTNKPTFLPFPANFGSKWNHQAIRQPKKPITLNYRKRATSVRDSPHLDLHLTTARFPWIGIENEFAAQSRGLAPIFLRPDGGEVFYGL